MEPLLTKSGSPITHGTRGTYNYWGCRCDLCRKASTEYNERQYKARRDRRIESSRRWNRDNPDYRKEAHLKRHYGLTLTEYQELENLQSGVCGICGKGETETVNGGIKLLAVDHDHETGAIRGLLCSKCNKALGGFEDRLDLLKGAINYLIGHNQLKE